MKNHHPSLRERSFWLAVVIMVIGCGSAPVLAKDAMKTVATLTTKYKPELEKRQSHYVRVIIEGLDKTTVDSATIKIKRGKDTFNYAVDPSNIVSLQPKVGMTEPKPGRIEFRLPADNSNPMAPKALQTFNQDDEVTLVINYNQDFSNDPKKGKYQPKSAIFRSGANSVVGNDDESKRIPVNGFKYTLDPVYSAFNDLDTLLYGVSGAKFEVRNLRFFSNVDEAFVTGFDTGALLGAFYDQGLPHFALDSSDTPGLKFFEDLVDAFAEPEPGMFVVSVGQLYSVEDGMVVATFLNAVQAAPEPPAVALCLAALLAMAWARRHRLAAPAMRG